MLHLHHRNRILLCAVALAAMPSLCAPASLLARGGPGAGGVGGASRGGGGPSGGGARAGAYGGRAGYAGRAYGPGGRGYYGRGPYYRGGYRGYGWGTPFAVGVGIGAGYGAYAYPGWGYPAYGYPAYGYYDYVPTETAVYPVYDPVAVPLGAVPVPSAALQIPGGTAQIPPRELSPAVVSSNAALPAGGGGAFVTQGEAAFRSGDYAKAVYAFRHAAVDDPQNAMTVLLLGHALFATGQFEEAAGTTQAALENLPRENWGAVIKRYRELYGKPQDYTAQLRTLERAIQNKPEDPALRFLAGYHYSYLGFTKQAIDQFDRVLKLAPQDEIARQLRNKMQEKIGTPVTPGPAAIPVSKEGPALPGTADAE